MSDDLKIIYVPFGTPTPDYIGEYQEKVAKAVADKVHNDLVNALKGDKEQS